MLDIEVRIGEFEGDVGEPEGWRTIFWGRGPCSESVVLLYVPRLTVASLTGVEIRLRQGEGHWDKRKEAE